MEKSSFFNAELVGEEYDRTYLAEDYAQYFASFIGNGVFPNPSNNLQVLADGTSMNITLKSGKAWVNGYFYHNTDDLILAIIPADGVLNRIDRVVLRLDFLNREIKCYVKKGAFASTPTAPSLQRDADMYEIALADIKVNKGAIAITQANITDLRQDSTMCGIVHGTVDQVDVTTLFNQYSNALELKEQGFEEEFTTWFNNIKGQLSGDVATNLAVQIEDLRTTKVNYTDLAPITTTGTSSAYIANIPTNMTEVTIVPHINNLVGATLNDVPILDREGKPISKDTLIMNIPTKLVRVGSNFFIASGGGGGSDGYDYSIKILADNNPLAYTYKDFVMIADAVTKTYTLLTASGQFVKKDYKTKETIATLTGAGTTNVKFDKYTRCISTNTSVIDYDTFQIVSGKRKIYPQDNKDTYSSRTTAIDEENGNSYTLYQKTLTVTDVNNGTVFTKILNLPGGETLGTPSVCVTKSYFVVLLSTYTTVYYLFDKTNGNFIKTVDHPYNGYSYPGIRGRKKDNRIASSADTTGTVIVDLDATTTNKYLQNTSGGAIFLDNGKVLVSGKNANNTNMIICTPETGAVWKTIPITSSYESSWKMDYYTGLIGDYELITYIRQLSTYQYIGIKTNFNLIEEVV